MNRIPLPPVIVLLGVVAQGCSSAFPWSDPSPAQPIEEVLPADPGTVTQLLSRVHARLGLDARPVRTGETQAMIATGRAEVRRGSVGPDSAPYARCTVASRLEGRDDDETDLDLRGPTGFATIELRTELEPVDEGTRLRSELSVTGTTSSSREMDGAALCTTTGRLETLLLDGVRGLVSPPDSIPERDPGERRPFR